MSISILSPLLYLLMGFIAGHTPLEIKGRASALLTKFVIPLVIIFNIATHRAGVFVIMLGMIVMMGVMLLVSRLQTRDPVQNLCFCYLNIGWLGLPVAGSLFGDGAAMVIIAAYVGSSLFGNSIGVGLMAQGQCWQTRLRQTLQAPPVWALAVGLATMPLAPQLEVYGKSAYDVLKFLMSFLGMAILGIWLSTTTIRATDFRQALWPFACRAGVFFILVSALIALCEPLGISLVTENKPTLYLLCLLPPAANIIVLETHYLKSGRSTSLIACGTCLSIVAIGVYAAVVLWLRQLA
ncbi:AEC family transporter [Dickeya oryzae]|uniref:AEC family transporter n=1 Tax=Dickeya oryzae TaxID=1240404 RepID=A0AB39IUH4_9GAMM|nr:permease [Dickeya oryzae]MCA6990232.1 permease [Dickeya oryzae]